MGATIHPDFQRRRVEWARTSCSHCGAEKLMSYEEYVSSYDPLDCTCGYFYFYPEFYPTEFQWQEASWTYSHIYHVLQELGIPVVNDQYSGILDPSFVIKNLYKVTSTSDRDAMADIAMLAVKLGVNIFWA